MASKSMQPLFLQKPGGSREESGGPKPFFKLENGGGLGRRAYLRLKFTPYMFLPFIGLNRAVRTSLVGV